ncbi:hypothetical protein E4665_01755 [Sporolactobacillus shoreae]|uniref:Uncharacterized protein n=1 Tax=Sporolactobacillus shoreae TaxID=1465501 RepID=A0A4Z0GV65_9BACL|nr:hypothetical protein [Sporolactobacillus shoreae]TGB00427.1 hypothetical protein E4665_01755 [Sporolactobacillus shoreae]
MIASYLQLLICYFSVGLLMGSMLGLLPFWCMWEKKHVAAFALLLVAWLPIALAAIFAAPLVSHFQVREGSEFR